jgi:hypothetical protein
MHQSKQYRLFIGWVMMRLGVEVKIGVSGLAVHFVSQRASRFPLQKEVTFTFGFHGELNGFMDAVEVV